MADIAVAGTTPSVDEDHQDNGPVPMSFPAILRTAGLSDRFAHLRIAPDRAAVTASPGAHPKKRREDREGKRWVRRKENGASTCTEIVPSSHLRL